MYLFVGCIFGGVYTPCIYWHARWSYRRRFRSLLLCPLSVERYYFPLLFPNHSSTSCRVATRRLSTMYFSPFHLGLSDSFPIAIHIWNIFAYRKFPGCSMAVPTGNDTLVKEANTSVLVAKTAIAIQYLAARSKPRSPWNYAINFATDSRPN